MNTNTLYDHAEDYDDQYTSYTADRDFTLGLVGEYAGELPVLEFGCGTGRLTGPISKEHQVIGVDLSRSMLARCEEKFVNLNIDLYLGDMCTFRVPRRTKKKHNLVLVPFTAFLHVIGVENQLKALRNFYYHLEPGGHLMIDIFNPSILHLVRGVERSTYPVEEKRVHLTNGDLLVRFQTTHFSQSTQRMDWFFDIKIYDAKTHNLKREYTEEATVQVIFPNEWRLLLNAAGFGIVQEWGSYDRRSFTDNSKRMLFLAKRPE